MEDTIESLKEKLFDLRNQICDYEDEIRDIEAYLIATYGHHEDLINDLNRNKVAKNSVETKFNELYQKLKNLEEENKNK